METNGRSRETDQYLTFFVGEEMFFGKDQLRDVEDSIVEQTTRAMPKTA